MNLKQYLGNVLVHGIRGGATALSSTVGVETFKALGLNVTSLGLKHLVAIAASAALISIMREFTTFPFFGAQSAPVAPLSAPPAVVAAAVIPPANTPP